MDATSAYLDFYPNIAKILSDEGITTAWLNVTYTLTPHGTYPTQFREAVEALRYVVEDIGRSPRDVILVSDSAGGNLCLALLSHISHPSPDIPRLDIAEPFKALVCLSPWVSFRHDWPSTEVNQYKDIDARDVTERWANGYLNGRSTNYYMEACDAPETWWEGAQVEQTLVLAGSDEMLLDPIRSWVGKFSVCFADLCRCIHVTSEDNYANLSQKLNPDTTLVVGQSECHIAPLIWPLFGDRHETQQGAALKSWLSERLRV
jgi:acetyl esterase/lipase